MYLKVMMPKRFQFRMVPSFKNFLLDRKGDIHYIGGGRCSAGTVRTSRRSRSNSRSGDGV